MARLGSVAIGGYFPTPDRLVPWIARMIRPPEEGRLAVLDPCAGRGEALRSLCTELSHKDLRISIYAIEMEKGRHDALEDALQEGYMYNHNVLHGDAFNASWDEASISLLWLNPPYDTDPVHGRLEQRFLDRFTGALVPGGILVFLVPFYALAASAATLAREYGDLLCLRFPSPEWDAFHQVVLVARRLDVPLWEPDPTTVGVIEGWARDPDSIPFVLGDTPISVYQIQDTPSWTFPGWRIQPVDVIRLMSEIRPWAQTDRVGRSGRIPGILPDVPLDDILIRRFPVAMPPRSAHIAAGIAAGVFNGSRIRPDDPASGLPDLLVKGVFNKEFRQVDEKTNKDGDVIGVVEVQQPRLVTTVLDLSTHTYHDIRPSSDRTGTTDVSSMTMADLLDSYGHSLMRTMLEQCPVMHDPGNPEHEIPLADVRRTLFRAQSHATQAAIKLLGGPDVPPRARRGRAAYVLGEIGSGKTTVALTVARTIGSRRMLVMCPPHLLDSWREQIDMVLGNDARTEVLSDVTDITRVAADEDPGLIVCLLSRETAKLGHAWESLRTCPRCGAPAPEGVDHAKKRSRCAHQPILAKGALARTTLDLARRLLTALPSDSLVAQFTPGRGPRRLAATLALRFEKDPKLSEAALEKVRATECLADALVPVVAAAREKRDDILTQVVVLLALADGRPEILARTVEAMWDLEGDRYTLTRIRSIVVGLLLAMPGDMREEMILRLQAAEKAEDPNTSPYSYSYHGVRWNDLRDRAVRMVDGTNDWGDWGKYTARHGKVMYDDIPVGCRKMIQKALANLAKLGNFKRGRACGEMLFQAVPQPRRIPLARFIANRHPRLFDLLVLDEAHEYANDGTAQERSAHRLTNLGIPTMIMTGTVMNGYAESLFTNMWALSPSFRAEFDRDERQAFVDRYGYRKQLVQDKDKETGQIVGFGSMTDRVERTTRNIGNAPGVLPLFILKHLLPLSVTLHKVDLSVDIPECSILVEHVTPDPTLLSRYESLRDKLIAQIRKDKFTPDLAGKLWGAMAELPAYLDLATSDTGNCPDGRYEIRYPESVGGSTVAEQFPFDASLLLPKERWMVDRVRRELSEGRNVMVFAWHTVLLPRLARIIERELGEKVVILDPAKVSTAKRQAWINREVIKKNRRVMVVNPVTIQTGLNNLVWFPTIIWMQNPACNPITYRQGIGRIDRVGQDKPTRVLFPVYDGTSQEDLHSLLLHKVAVSMSTDGLDAEAALQAAGVLESDDFSGFAVGRQLYEILAAQKPAAQTATPIWWA